jgi:signal transduction histidine kinase
LSAMGAVLLALGAHFYAGYARDLRDSARRVNFVNQVSHELKTPLTNIRMYAELLEQNLPQDAAANEQARRYMGVIVSESQRLSRLIINVLTFARQQRRSLRLNPQPAIVDHVIDAAIEQFRPSLEAAGIAVDVQRGASRSVRLDADAAGQILGNLISNVEKYAAGGKRLSISSSQESGRTTIRVADGGGGIPASHREKIFQPFYRISNELSDGVTGTGIGLSIARELARLHGGDVVLEPSGRGAVFCISLATPDA